MFFRRKYKYEKKDGIVVVSIRNLFHLFDLSRKEIPDDSNSQKSNIRAFTSSEFNSLKKRETIQSLKSTNKESEIESRTSEIKSEETKDFLLQSENKEGNLNKKESIKKMPTMNKQRQIINKKRKKGKCCDYFTNLVLCNVLLLIFNNCILWIFC